MAVIETLTFRLVDGIDEESFLEVDTRVQTSFAYRQPGLLRRTTARGADGTWLVLDLWASAADADACADRWATDPLAAAFMALVAPETVQVDRFQTRD